MKDVKKLLLSIILILSCLTLFSQRDEEGGITTSISQDLKFASIGDISRGYKAMTLDILVRVKLQGDLVERDKSRTVVLIEFEHANLSPGYTRYGVGYGRQFEVFNTPEIFFIPELRWQALPYVMYGMISRDAITGRHFTFGLEHSTKISKEFSFIASHQLTHRRDLEWMYGDKNKWKYSFFIGVEFKL